jgi:hypothetical protein
MCPGHQRNSTQLINFGNDKQVSIPAVGEAPEGVGLGGVEVQVVQLQLLHKFQPIERVLPNQKSRC